MIGRVLRWARARRRLVLTAAVAATVLSLFAVRRLTFDADVLHLLPRHGRVVPAFEQFLQRFGSLDYLYVVFDAPAGHTVDEYEDQIRAFVARLSRLPEIERVDAGLFGEGRDWGSLADRSLLLLSPERAREALDRLTPARMPGEIAAARDLLSVPSEDVARMVQQDPIGLFGLLRDQLQGAAASVTIDPARGGYVTKDGRSQLVLARPTRPPFDTEFSKRLFAHLAEIQREAAADATARATGSAPDASAPTAPAGSLSADDEALPPLHIEFAGGHRIALETEAEVRGETVWNSVGSLAVILPLLYLAFRSPWLVAVGAIPSALGIVIVLALYAAGGITLSGAAAGAVAMQFGLGIDGVVLMFVAFRHFVSDGRTPDEAATTLMAEPAASMVLGMWTTAATFYGLTIIDFPSLQELGALIGHGMVLCGVLTLILVPALLPRNVGRRVSPLTAWWLTRLVTKHARTILIGAAVVTVALGVASLWLRVNPGLEKLRSSSAAADMELRIATRFGLPRDVYVVLARGPALEPLLVENERFVAALTRERPKLLVYAPTALLPSQQRQAEAAARIEQARLDISDIRARVEAAAREAGFREGTFVPFLERLPRLLDTRARLTFDGFHAQGLDDVLGRTIVQDERGGYVLATYLYPSSADDVRAIRHSLEPFADRMTLTGLPEVDRELASRFTPEFLKGLAFGTALVVGLIVFSFRRADLTVLALVPTLLALVWAAGVLAIAGVELDLFSVFAVMTFVGIGVDYGIHMVHRFHHASETDAPGVIAHLGPVILVAGAITLLGFGTLVTSSYGPLRSLGVISSVMIVTLMFASLLVLPALLIRRRRG